MLPQVTIDHYASGMRIDTFVAERDVVLTYVLRILEDAGLLKRLALKGGTCLKKIYYGKTTRFSEDLDFTSLDSGDVNKFAKELEEIFDRREHYEIVFNVKETNLKKEGTTVSYRAVIEYEHEWNKATFILDISYREKPALSVNPMPLIEELYFEGLEFEIFDVPSFKREELMAEKIRAAFQRLRARDIYDLHRYSDNAYDKQLVKTLAVIKCWNVHEMLEPHTLLEKIQRGKHNWEGDLKRLVRPGSLPNTKKLVSETTKHYSYLTNMDDVLTQIAEDATKHKLTSVVNRILAELK